MKYSIEIIRLVAVVLITFTHTRHSFTDGFFYFIIEDFPTYGTMILSVVSGYLFWNVSKKNESFITKKTKNLLIPYLIANVAILIPVITLNYFGYNFLNRLNYDMSLITEGLFALNSPPVNPPTYFVRDLFMIFVLIEFFFKKNLKMLLLIVPFAIFGQIILRYDILIMFVAGVGLAKFQNKIDKKLIIMLSFLAGISALFFLPEYAKYFVAIFIFVMVIDLPLKFCKTGGYSYILHLYHSPVIVATFPFVDLMVTNLYLKVVLQILLALTVAGVIYIITRKFDKLKIISGGR